MPAPLSNGGFMGVARVVVGLLFIVAGVLHFVRPHFYLKIMPPFIPQPLAMVYISGVFEILGGLGLMLPAWRTAAAYGLIALLVAVFPANIYMAQKHFQTVGANGYGWLLIIRLCLQPLFIWWVYRLR